MFDLFPRAEFIHNLIDESQKFTNEIANRHFLAFAEIDHLSVESVTHGAPFVLFDQHLVMEPESQIVIEQSVELSDQCLKQSSNGDGVINARRNITDAKLQCGKEGMRPHVPIDLLAIVDASGLDQEFHITLKGAVGLKVIRDSRSRHPGEDF